MGLIYLSTVFARTVIQDELSLKAYMLKVKKKLCCFETGIKYSLNIFIIQKLSTVQWCVVQWSIPELGMQLGGLGAEVLPHRIGALTTQRKGSTLKWKNII